jgi:hypothetical protein
MSRRIIEGSYARLCGLRDTAVKIDSALPASFGEDYISILSKLRASTEDIFDGFDLGNNVFFHPNVASMKYNAIDMKSKINQLIQYLEMVHSASNKIVEVGSVYNLIRDPELKSRCSDLLSAVDHFDRVINQATQVLEERVRKKVPSLENMTGLPLVGKAINPEPSKSMIVFSTNPSEQEGYANLFKGLMGTFRNQSHHKFLETVTREQALQICAFIDNMLAALEGAEVKTAL